MSSARLYVGHLSYKARESDVEDLFSRYGKVREILLKNGFGFVEFDDARDAEEAVYRCNGKEIRGERIVVEITKRPPRGRDTFRYGGGGGRYSSYNNRDGGGGGGRSNNFYREPTRRREDNYPTQTRYRVIVENLSSRVSWQDLKDVMRSAGEVTYADAHRIKPNEGVVCYRRPEDLKRAMETLDGKDLHGRRIKLIDGTRESRSRSRSNSRSRSSHSRSRSKSSRSKSRSRSASHSRSRSASSKRSNESPAKNGAAKMRSRSKERSAGGSADRKRRASSHENSRSRSPAAENGRRSEAEE